MRKRISDHLRQNIALARKWIGKLERQNYQALINLSEEYGFSIALGDLLLLDGKWYVTHAGLLRIAQRRRCSGIKTVIQDRLSDPPSGRWVFRATVYKTSTLSRLRRLRRRRSLQCLFLGPRRRDARRRNPRRQPRPPQGLRHRPLFGRGTRLGSQIQRTRHHPISARPPRTEITATRTASLASATASAC